MGKQTMKFIVVGCLFMMGCYADTDNKPDEQEENAAAPNIMVNDRHYHTTGLENKDDSFEADGTISSSVGPTEIPYKNDPSNFGTGYKYDVINDNTVYVHIQDKWIKYEYYDLQTVK